MKKSFITQASLITIAYLATGCDLLEKGKKIIKPFTEQIQKEIIEEKQVTINSCTKETIDEWLSEEWEIIEEKKSEVVCTWKQKKATRGCNIKKDKGCAITVPETMGTKVDYRLERVLKK